jgi:hypothetical protein
MNFHTHDSVLSLNLVCHLVAQMHQQKINSTDTNIIANLDKTHQILTQRKGIIYPAPLKHIVECRRDGNRPFPHWYLFAADLALHGGCRRRATR